LFAISRRAGFVPSTPRSSTTLSARCWGEDGKPFKTRSGGTVKLAELLDEAVERAARLLAEREADLSAGERETVARQVGIAR